jgi:integrase
MASSHFVVSQFALAAKLHASILGLGDPVHLSFAPDIVLELCNQRQDAHDQLSRAGGRVYRGIIRDFERNALLRQLRWSDINFNKATLRVAQVVELVGGKVTVKEPKTERSRRTIALPARLVEELKAYRKEHAELCLALGLGKIETVFPHWPDGTLRNPSHFTKAFSREVAAAKLPHITFHGLRHTYITHLLRSGVPVHVVSARAGHANPTVTLNIYAHLLPGQQEEAAAVIDAALREALPD